MLLDCIKSQNQCINTLVFPGALWHPSYTEETFHRIVDLQLIFIPFEGAAATPCLAFSAPSSIPALLYVNKSKAANKFCINFHGNGCDVGQISVCAAREGRAFNAHYLLVEYPRYGIADGHPNEAIFNAVAKAVYGFVEQELKVDHSQIVIIGRSIGTGPSCYLASHLQSIDKPVAAVLLQSPFCSIREVVYELLGCAAYFMLDRWENWRSLVGDAETDKAVIRSPVLFIHADRDHVIDCNHSVLMHQSRLKCGLLSELFVQKSDALFIKGHNYFDYDKDVLAPSTDFLFRHFDQRRNPSGSSGSLVHSDSTEPLSIALKPVFRMAPSYVSVLYTEAVRMTNAATKVSVFKSAKCTSDIYAGWCCCPLIFCTECSCACSYHAAAACYLESSNALGLKKKKALSPSFDYSAMRPFDPNRNTLWRSISNFDKFSKHVNEVEAAHCSHLRRQQQHNTSAPQPQQQQTYNRSVLSPRPFVSISSEASTVKNPLLQPAGAARTAAGDHTSLAAGPHLLDEEEDIMYIPG